MADHAAKQRDDALKAAQKETAERTAEQLKRSESTQPTPTQEENDRAKLGLHSVEELDDKEDDGSPEDKSLTAGAAAPYTTRAAAPAKK